MIPYEAYLNWTVAEGKQYYHEMGNTKSTSDAKKKFTPMQVIIAIAFQLNVTLE